MSKPSLDLPVDASRRVSACPRSARVLVPHRPARRVLSAALLAGLLVHWLPDVAQAQRGPSPVVASPVVEREVSAEQTFVGTVVPLRKSAVGSAVDGRVVEFPVREGDRVEKGATLGQLLTETLRLQLAAAEAELELRKEELAELENGTRPEEIAQARARMNSALAQRDYAKSKATRMQSLFRQGRAASEDELQAAVSAAASAEESYHEGKAAYELAVQGPRPERIAQARARVASQVEEANRLKDQIKKHTIIAPFDGYISAEHTEVGQWVKQGELVAEVVALDEVDVRAHILESQIRHVRVGMPVYVEVPALPTEVLTGTVARIVPQADVRARTFPVNVRVKNVVGDDGPLVKAGMLARIKLPIGPVQQALLVPKDALVLGGPRPVVFVVDGGGATRGGGPPSGKVRPVPVDLGIAQGKLIQVKGELAAGQHVVVIGNERLRPGQDVVVTEVIVPEEPADVAAAPRATSE